MKNFLTGLMLSLKRKALIKFTKQSTSSISTVQKAISKLIDINDNIDKTTHEVEKIESDLNLIKNE